ncbi:MAG TPA: hypothetical protein VG478_14000 [Acidimicrobiales bacterium]|nr:hypothetical protein [Acidimicrobiales bacterium]
MVALADVVAGPTSVGGGMVGGVLGGGANVVSGDVGVVVGEVVGEVVLDVVGAVVVVVVVVVVGAVTGTAAWLKLLSGFVSRNPGSRLSADACMATRPAGGKVLRVPVRTTVAEPLGGMAKTSEIGAMPEPPGTGQTTPPAAVQVHSTPVNSI